MSDPQPGPLSADVGDATGTEPLVVAPARRSLVQVTLERFSFHLLRGPGEPDCNRLPGVPVDDVGLLATRLIGRETVECMVVFFVDAHRRVFGFTEVERGSVSALRFLPVDAIRPALWVGASAIVVCHNHPLGAPRPSDADVASTFAMAEACELMHLELVAHLVVAGDHWATVPAVQPRERHTGRHHALA